ncbi:MAG: WYL domain-containing protein [Anaeromyxobacter sp.]|nr:WYL domain-containing protein [Anaeromyxobacter sp.]MBL0275027.1 WYL domain-containing protein [Anaeromyxobacter sp.]
MSDSLQRMRRLLLLLPVVARASARGKGLPLAKAVEVTGARDEAAVRDDVAAVRSLWVEPTGTEEAIDLYLEDGEVWVTYAQPFGTPPAFSLAEGALLLSALEPYAQDGGKPVKDLVRKLRRAVPTPLRQEADRLARGLDVATPPGPWAATLQQAIDQRREATLEYRAVAEGAVSRKVVEPRLLFQRGGAWYLAAWSVARAEEHLYRLDRLASAELGARVFGDHKGPPVARYTRRNLYFESGREREVTLRYSGHAARLARERHGARARPNPDGTVGVTVAVTPGNYLVGSLLGQGGEAAVDGPPDVVELLRARAAELLRQYQDG